MDHLPRVGTFNRIKRTLEVPYLVPEASRQWTPRGVSVFCQPQDYMLERLPANEELFAPEAKSLFASFLAKPNRIEINRQERGDDVLQAAQLTLWQGLLVEAFAVGDVLIDINKFITQNEYGESIVTTAALTEYICYWHLNVDRINDETRNRHLDQLFDLFRAAAQWFLTWATRLHFIDPPPSAQVGYSMRLGHPCHNRSYPRVQAILLSIQILHETLYNVAINVYSVVSRGPDGCISVTTPNHPISNNVPVSGYYGFVDALMLDAGWCPNEVALLPHQTIRTRQHTLRYFLSTVDRRSLGRDHSRCTRHRCYKIVEYPYLPDHVTASCTCPNMFTSTDEGTGEADIATIIREGSIPLVKIRSGGTDDEILEVLSYDPAKEPSLHPRYIAISHVWSDGKGNRSGNYLPACQIRRLQDSVNYAHYFSTTNLPDEEEIRRVENVPFWIDTLCIPRHHRAERKCAIRTMSSVYRNAASVLVLDQGMKRTNCQTNITDILMAVAHSNWGRRLWTLQEGRLAARLQFEFENGLLSLDSDDDLNRTVYEGFFQDFPQQLQLESIRAEIESGGHNRATAVLLLNALASRNNDLGASELYRQHLHVPAPAPMEEHELFERFFGRMGVFWLNGDILKFALNAVSKALSHEKESVPNHVNFFNIVENLRLRRTTEPSDEAVCMATMLDADTNMILNTESNDRMAALLESLDVVPSSLLFFQGERYAEDGRRWIPKTFLLQNGRLGNIWGPLNPNHLLKITAKPTPNGLQTSFPGIQLLSPLRGNDPERCYLTVGTEKYAMVLTEGNKLKLARTDWTTYATKKLAIILSNSLTYKSQAWGGVLVSYRSHDDLVPDEEEQSTDYVRFEHTVFLHKCEQGHSLDRLKFYDIVVDWAGFDGKEEFASAAVLPEDHKWCMG